MVLLTGLVSAETTISIQPASQSVIVGNQVTFTVQLAPTIAISGASMDLTYNPAVMRLDTVTIGSVFGANIFSNTGNIATPGKITNIYIASLNGGSISTQGAFLVVKGTLLTPGSTDITILNGKAAKADITYDTTIIQKGVIISGYIREDVNEDGKVDLLDLLEVGKHFGEASALRFDATGNGVVDLLDLLFVGKKYLVA